MIYFPYKGSDIMSFADELRKTAAPKKKPDPTEGFYDNYDKKVADLANACVCEFERKCQLEAGKRQHHALWVSSSDRCRIKYGGFFDMQMRACAKQMANDVKSVIESKVRTMGFRRFAVRISSHCVSSPYGTGPHSYQFAIEAWW